ncbi:MAG: DUF4965 domain-containing protein [Planctomycetota bacterium]|nr:DUF4965 domain-containing protein [Planctomycetota bacterium]
MCHTTFPWSYVFVPLALVIFSPQARAAELTLRPPAVPLVTHDPYFSIWSPADRLTDVDTTHWTGKRQPLRSLVRVDGRAFRVLGAEPQAVPPLPQTDVQVLPTRTICRFANTQVKLTLTCLTPALPADLDVLARPVTYLTWEVQSADGQPHAVQLYFEAGAELAVNVPSQQVLWERPAVAGLEVLKLGSSDQPVLAKKGDDLRIDWGYLYLAAAKAQQPQTRMVDGAAARRQFIQDGTLSGPDAETPPRAVQDGAPVLAVSYDLGAIRQAPVARHVMVAYDDLYAIKYFRQRLRPYWRRNGAEAADVLTAAARDYAALTDRCRQFDTQLLADLTQVGGEKYALLCALAYRQTIAGNKLAADEYGLPLLFPKENFSNGCIATVDVLFPQSPFFLVLSPALTKAMLVPILDYAASARWKFAYAPHDLGTYPLATGQVYGGGERTDENQMPVEESGNMMLLLAALAKAEGHGDLAKRYWPLVTKWADYLVANGLDPENQLCSADMFGHLPRNANLALKAILGIGGYAQLCDLVGQPEAAQKYLAIARDYAAKWQVLAKDEGHTRLAYHKPGTWGMKHNLIWDRVLGLKLFPDAVGDAEIAWYLQVQQPYGLTCDNRTDTCLIDWALWSIAPARSDPDFRALVDPLFRYAHETPSRVPLSDWFVATDAKQKGFQARPVVGGLFIKLLADDRLWQRWAKAAAPVTGAWAPAPISAAVKQLVPTAETAPVPWRYTCEKPADGWFQPGFDDAAWQPGPAGFGSHGTPGAAVRTEWKTTDIWLRREFTWPDPPPQHPLLRMHYDEDPEVYLNGVLAAKLIGWSTSYDEVDLTPAARAVLRPGKNLLAVHAHQTYGGQYIDVGLVDDGVPLPPPKP